MKLIIDGQEYSGTKAELLARLEAVQEGDYYRSSTRGMVRIADMDSKHIQNAILKQLREQMESVRGLEPAQFLSAIKVGYADQPEGELKNLCKELEKRVEEQMNEEIVDDDMRPVNIFDTFRFNPRVRW